ncbi:AP2 domain-containing protein [Bacillus sp. JCM 19041]|uniref:AP2 domain-containing protein n=1 Tax=Bacillus sp. JCM 19041 TaxID=1460637 RepID=UPI0006D1924F
MVLDKTNQKDKSGYPVHTSGAAYVTAERKLDSLSTKISKRNTSGVRGVSFSKRTNKYMAYIRFQNKHMNLGCYKTLEEAKEARIEAENKYFKPILEKYGKVFK